VLIAIATFGTCMTIALFWKWDTFAVAPAHWKESLATSLFVGLGGLLTVSVLPRGSWASLALSAIAFGIGLTGHAAYRFGLLPRPAQPVQVVSHISSSLYALELTTYREWLPKSPRRGGGIAVWEDGYVVANGDGRLSFVRELRDKAALLVRPLAYSVPLNVGDFVKGAREVLAGTFSNRLETSRFRVADVAIRRRGDDVMLLVSHHYWRSDEKCFVMRVSMLEGSDDRVFGSTPSLEWQTLYETSPCLTINTDGLSGTRFEGLENGGRMAFLGANELLLTIGDHEFDGVNRPSVLAQDPNAAYGKILRVDLSTGEAAVFSSGHRNPQGLVVATDGRIWSIEHGPRGGDELNLIEERANYGWPLVTYGTDYGRYNWPPNKHQGRHDHFTPPVYAFVPSVGLSSLVEAPAERFPFWRGDLLLGTLVDQTLWRIRIEGGRVVIAEPMRVGTRIRDISTTKDGRLVIWSDEDSLTFVDISDEQTGDALVTQCTGCHGLAVWDTSFRGPHLAGILGRSVATESGFPYSDAMKAAGGTWTRERLDRFLSDPQVAVPGTAMVFPGIEDPEKRAAIIAFLSSDLEAKKQ
jgi:cytochrome c2